MLDPYNEHHPETGYAPAIQGRLTVRLVKIGVKEWAQARNQHRGAVKKESDSRRRMSARRLRIRNLISDIHTCGRVGILNL